MDKFEFLYNLSTNTLTTKSSISQNVNDLLIVIYATQLSYAKSGYINQLQTHTETIRHIICEHYTKQYFYYDESTETNNILYLMASIFANSEISLMYLLDEKSIDINNIFTQCKNNIQRQLKNQGRLEVVCRHTATFYFQKAQPNYVNE